MNNLLRLEIAARLLAAHMGDNSLNLSYSSPALVFRALKWADLLIAANENPDCAHEGCGHEMAKHVDGICSHYKDEKNCTCPEFRLPEKARS